MASLLVHPTGIYLRQYASLIGNSYRVYISQTYSSYKHAAFIGYISWVRSSYRYTTLISVQLS
jgi:hypothetical protein